MTQVELDNHAAPRPVRLFNPDLFSLLFLVMAAASILTYWLGTDHPYFGSASVAAPLMLFIAFLKAWVVGNYFMEIRECPRNVRMTFNVWTAFSAISTIAFVLFI
jgi:hypothetical protein